MKDLYKKFPISFELTNEDKKTSINVLETFFIDVKNEICWDWSLGSFEDELIEVLEDYRDKINFNGENYCFVKIGYEKIEDYEFEIGKPKSGGHFIEELIFDNKDLFDDLLQIVIEDVPHQYQERLIKFLS
jgi:hypothetical protein